MAIDVNNSRFILAAAKNGVSFARTLTLGRQGLFLPPELLRRFFKEFGLEPKVDPSFFAAQSHLYCEGFFEGLGAKSCESVDFSDYEGATHIHDLNTPIPVSLQNKYDAVVDAGTIEHIFNAPVALLNAMQMVRQGGRLILNLPANNCCGHGFYQFSPEFFFRLFSPENGFEIDYVCMAENAPFSRFYRVNDPLKVGERVELVNGFPVHLFVQARKIAQVNVLSRFPAQADYSKIWETKQAAHKPILESRGLKLALQTLARTYLPKRYWRFTVLRNFRRTVASASLNNNNSYVPIDLPSYSFEKHS